MDGRLKKNFDDAMHRVHLSVDDIMELDNYITANSEQFTRRQLARWNKYTLWAMSEFGAPYLAVGAY